MRFRHARGGAAGVAGGEHRASGLYQRVCELLRERGVPVAEGVFRAHMEVELVNDGPVTILLDSESGRAPGPP